MAKSNIMLISAAIVFKESRGKKKVFVVKAKDEDKWEFPKITVRRGESSVRSALRLTGEMCGINARILEEAGRSGGSTVVNGKLISQRFYYYLLIFNAASEAIAFEKYEWLEYSRAIRRLSTKKEQNMLRQARELFKKWEKENQKGQ